MFNLKEVLETNPIFSSKITRNVTKKEKVVCFCVVSKFLPTVETANLTLKYIVSRLCIEKHT